MLLAEEEEGLYVPVAEEEEDLCVPMNSVST